MNKEMIGGRWKAILLFVMKKMNVLGHFRTSRTSWFPPLLVDVELAMNEEGSRVM